MCLAAAHTEEVKEVEVSGRGLHQHSVVCLKVRSLNQMEILGVSGCPGYTLSPVLLIGHLLGIVGVHHYTNITIIKITLYKYVM